MWRVSNQVKRLQEAISILRFKSYETSISSERSKERYRRIGLSAIASASAQGVSILTSLISVPLTLGYLGAERYGLWVVISSTIAMLNFADLGMGNGLINAISDANGKNDKLLAHRYVSSAFFMLAGIALAIGTIFVIFSSKISWSWFLNISSPQAVNEAGPAITVFLACFLVNLPLGVIQRIQIGYQEGFFNSLWQAFGNLLALGSILLAIYFKAKLPWLVFAMTGVPIFATILNGVVLFGFRRPWLLPKLKAVTLFVAQKVSKIGFLFLILQIAATLGYQSDNLVISHFLGASYVPQYSIPMKLFMLIPLLLSFILSPLWPAYGEATTRKDFPWIRKTFFRSVKLALIVNVVPALLLIIFAPLIIHIWAGTNINPPFSLLLGLGIWTILISLGGPIAMLLNGANAIGIQVVCALLMGVSNPLLSIYLVQKIGVAGPIYGTIITWTLFCLVPFLIYIPRMFASLQLSWKQ
jgi:O-antigen/teichoic acid export membrane protein